MSKCFDYIDSYGTNGQPIYKRQCYCSSTMCLQGVNITFDADKVSVRSPLPMTELTPEEEKKFYDHVRKSNAK